jgi:hypothetical protein
VSAGFLLRVRFFRGVLQFLQCPQKTWKHSANRNLYGGPKMKVANTFVKLAVACLLLFVTTQAQEVTKTTNPSSNASSPARDPRLFYANVPMSFEANIGQLEVRTAGRSSDAAGKRADRVKFRAHGAGYTVSLTSSKAILAVTGIEGKAQAQAGAMLDLKLVGANPAAHVDGLDELPGKTNYFLSSDPKAWFTQIPTYGRVGYRDIYRGVDLYYYGNQNRLEYDFVVAPGVDPRAIALQVEGTDRLRIDAAGNLSLSSKDRELIFQKPVAYQSVGNDKHLVASSYTLDRNQQVRFALGSYDHTKPLVIDPVLSYSTFVGTASESVTSVTADSSGNTYLGGRSGGLVFVEKLSADGTTVLYTTVFGSGYNAQVETIRVDSSGKAYITGFSGTGFPTTAGAFRATVVNGTHAYLAVVDSTGSSLVYASYLAGKTTDEAFGLAVDSLGKVYIAGFTDSSDFPTTAGAFQTTLSASGQSAFVSKFDPTASGAASLVYSTLLGGATTATVENTIAVDGSGNAYVTGQGGADFPITTGAFSYGGTGLGQGGVFVTKLNPSASALVYSAYLGPGVANSIALDGTGDAYVAGNPQIDDFPTTAGAYQTTFPSGFVTELNPSGSALVYSTFLSGPSGTSSNVTTQDLALAPGCSSKCAAYVTGFTNTTDFPAVNPIQSFNASAPTQGNDAFVVELAGDGTSAVFSTYLGGSGDESSFNSTPHTPGIGVDSTGNAYVGGNTNSTDFPITLTTTPARQSFIAKISPTNATLAVASPGSLAFTSQPVGVPSAGQTVLVRNMGSVPLGILPFTMTGANNGDFSQTNNCGASLPGGSSCTVTVTFTPAASGSRVASLNVNGNTSSTVVSLNGAAVDAAFISLSTSTLNFGNQTVEVASPAQTVTLTNAGNTALTIFSYNVSGDFGQTNNCPASLASKASCTINISFLPTQEGLRTGTISVNSNSHFLANPTINETGTGVAGNPSLVLSTAGLVFNPQDVNTTSGLQFVAVTNTGNVPVTISSVSATGDFMPTGCLQTLSPGQSCSVRVSFTPTAAGTRTGVVTLMNNSPVGTLTFNASGVGVAQVATLSVTPTALDFKDLPLGITSATLQIIVTNIGNAPVIFDRVLESGDFRVTSTSCSSFGLRPTNSCSTNVSFTPTALGVRNGTIKFIDSATGNPHIVNLAGNGIAVVRSVVATPLNLAFADQAVLTSSSTQNAIVLNNGNVPINFSNVAASGNDFTASTGCTTLGVAQQCFTQVTFTPTTTGLRNSTLTFTDDAGSQVVNLSGNGVTATKTLTLIPSGMTFEDQKNGTTSPQQILFLRNTGTAPINIASVTPSGDLALTFNGCPAALNPFTSCQLGVTFTPSGLGARTGAITINDDAAGNPHAVNLLGNGVATAPTIMLSPSALAYDLAVTGTTSNPQGVTISNTTASTVTGLSVVPSGDYALGFNSCGTSLNANSSCSVNVTFSPTAAGSRTGTITVNNSAGTQKVNLAGFGATPVLSALLRESSVVFADRVVTTSSPSQSIVFQNTGNSPITISSITLTGADFGISNGCPVSPSTFAPSPFGCTISVTFTPTATGTLNGSIKIIDNAPGSPRTINLKGNGLAPTQGIVVTPPTSGLVFSNQDVGTPSNGQNIMLTNTGNSPVTISKVKVATGATDYGISDGCTGILQPGPFGNACFITVTFTPAAAGTRAGSIQVTDTAPGSPRAINLTGTGVTPTQTVVVSPTSIVFGNQVKGTTSSVIQTVTVSNTGNAPVTFTNATLTGDFSIPFNGCTGSLAPGAGSICQIQISFTPTAVGARTGTLTIADNATGNPQKVSLSGTGIATTQAISLSQTSVTFDAQIINTPSAPIVVYYYNQGNVAVTISTVALAGADYSLSGSGCVNGTFVSPNSFCTLRVTYKPAAVGMSPGTITITDSAPGGSRSITLSGTGINAGPGANVFPASLAFGNQKLGTTSTPQTVTLTNSGNANLVVSGVTITGPNNGDFNPTNNCTTVAPGFSCAITVTFSPTATGSRSAVLNITDNANPTTQTVNLGGTGLPGPVPVVSLSPTSLDFGTVSLNTQSAPKPVMLTNTGTGTLNIPVGGITVTGTIQGNFKETDNCGTTVAPGAHCTITVTFTPSATIDQTGSVNISDNAAGSPQSVALAGEGVAPAVFLSVNSLVFGSQKVGTTSGPQIVTLTNSGSAALSISGIAATGDFLATPSCPASLAPGASCTISVTFKPSATGGRFGILDITDNAPDSPQDVDLSGTGTP